MVLSVQVPAFLKDEGREWVASQTGNSPDITSVNRYRNGGTLIFHSDKNLCARGTMSYPEHLRSVERAFGWLTTALPDCPLSPVSGREAYKPCVPGPLTTGFLFSLRN